MRALLERCFLVLVGLALLAFVIFGAYGAIGYGTAIYRAYALSDNWPSVPGVVTSSAAIQGCGRVGVGYYLSVRYRYAVNNVEYFGDRVWLGNGYCSGRVGAEAMAAKFVPGTSRFVYVNPNMPSDSVLISGRVENGTIFLFLLLASIPVAAVILAARAVMDYRRQSRSHLGADQVLMRRALIDRGIRLEIEERKREIDVPRGRKQDAEPLAAADPDPLRGFGRLSSNVRAHLMWPFSRKSVVPVTASDEVSAAPQAEPEKINVKTICPACLEAYLPGVVWTEYPFCAECGSEGADIPVVPYEEFLGGKSVSELEEMQRSWSARTGLLDQFKSLVASRIEELLREKRAL